MRVNIDGTLEEVSNFLVVKKENIKKLAFDDSYKINDIDFILRNAIVVHHGRGKATVDMTLEEMKVYGK